jgi:hypothetical protein
MKFYWPLDQFLRRGGSAGRPDSGRKLEMEKGSQLTIPRFQNEWNGDPVSIKRAQREWAEWQSQKPHPLLTTQRVRHPKRFWNAPQVEGRATRQVGPTAMKKLEVGGNACRERGGPLPQQPMLHL